MKKLLLPILCLLACTSICYSQVKPEKHVIRIKIKHASPALIAMLLHGHVNFDLPPEPDKK